MKKSLLISLITLALAVAGLWLPQSDVSLEDVQSSLGGQTTFSGPVNSKAGFQESGTEVIDTNGNYVGAVDTGSNSLTVGSNGTAINEYVCASQAWNPGSVSSSTDPQTLDISVSNASLGDVALASFDSATSTEQWEVHGSVTGAGTGTVTMVGTDGQSAVDISTSTAKVCVIR